MLKPIVITIACVIGLTGPITTTSNPKPELTQEPYKPTYKPKRTIQQLDNDYATQTLIRSHGYSCNDIDDIIYPFGWDTKAWYVYCKEPRYNYEITDHGGKLFVRPWEFFK